MTLRPVTARVADDMICFFAGFVLGPVVVGYQAVRLARRLLTLMPQGSPPAFRATGGDTPGHVDDLQGVGDTGSTPVAPGPAGAEITPDFTPDSSTESAPTLLQEGLWGPS